MIDFLLLAISQLLTFGTSLFVTKLQALSYTPEVVAEIIFYLTIINVYSQIISGPVSLILKRDIVDFYRSKDPRNLSILMLSYVMGTITVCSIIIFILYLSSLLSAIIFMSLVAAMFASINSLSLGCHNANGNRREYFIATTITCIGRILAAVLLLFFALSLEDYLFTLTLISMIALMIIIIKFWQFYQLGFYKPNFNILMVKITEARHIYMSSIPFLILQISDKWILYFSGNEETLGKHGVYVQIGYASILLLSSVVIKYLYPIQIHKDKNRFLDVIGFIVLIVSFIILYFDALLQRTNAFDYWVIKLFANTTFIDFRFSIVNYAIGGLCFSVAMILQQEQEVRREYLSLGFVRVVSSIVALATYFYIVNLHVLENIDEGFAFVNCIFLLLVLCSRYKKWSFRGV